MKIQSDYAQFVEGNSSKMYRIAMTQESEDITVSAEWGRIGGTSPQQGVKYQGTDRVAAEAVYRKTIESKVAKGYVVMVDPKDSEES